MIVNNLRKITLLCSLLLLSMAVRSQTYLISIYNGQTINSCSGMFQDAGGNFANYTFNEDYTVTFCSNNSIQTHSKLYFSQFNIHPGDTLYVFDGASTAAPCWVNTTITIRYSFSPSRLRSRILPVA